MKSLLFVPWFTVLLLTAVDSKSQQQSKVTVWLTKADSSQLFKQQPGQVSFGKIHSGKSPVISINADSSFQSIDGFGFALTQGSAMHMMKMSPAKRASLIRELFDTTGNNIGVSYIRLSIGASDLNETIYSYNDLPPGKTDTALENFDLGPDRKEVIPVMKEILAVNPAITIMGSPWSPPAWMKTNHDTRGGRLDRKYYAAYAKYFLKYIRSMKAEGITIDAITVQNEPLHPGNNPSLLMTAPEQAEFISKHLGPLFRAHKVSTRIVIYDHNADRPDYPIYILNDSVARQYIDGSAFHLYGGEIEALSDVHDAHPDKHIYFTEQMVVQFAAWKKKGDHRLNIASPVARLFIGATRNWSRNVLEWNLSSNPELTPYTDRGGCSICQGAVTIDGDSVSHNLAYYAMAHASKFVRPGSVRIFSDTVHDLPNVAFLTPDSRIVLLVANTGRVKKEFSIKYKGQYLKLSLEAGDAATCWWYR